MVIYHHPWKLDGDDDDANDGVGNGDSCIGMDGRVVVAEVAM